MNPDGIISDYASGLPSSGIVSGFPACGPSLTAFPPAFSAGTTKAAASAPPASGSLLAFLFLNQRAIGPRGSRVPGVPAR